MKQNIQPVINGDGTFSRDFTYVDNAVNANILAMFTTNLDTFGQAFNIGCGEQYSLNKLVDVINEELKKNIKPIYGNIRPGDVAHSNANISKAKKLLNYNVLIKFDDGIKKLLN